MIAEIRGKVNTNNTNLSELREDELTGNFFGSLRYIPFNKGMKKILRNAIRPYELQNVIDSIIDSIDTSYWDDNLFLWDKVHENHAVTELDVRMDFENICIGIEVKYQSGLSSEDDKTDVNVSAENSRNQLSKEARVLRKIAPDKTKLLLLLADETVCAETIKGVKSIDEVHLGYISWQEVLVQLKKLTDLNTFEKLIIEDLIELLERKGFLRFDNFNILENDMDSEGTMKQGEKIFNAFALVNKTHEKVSQLMEYCKILAVEKKEYDLISPKFLRYRSDVDYWGWNMTQMFLLFQDTQDELLESGWRNGPVYVLDILLYDPDECFESNEPRLEMAKFEYEDIKNFSPGVSSASYDYFYHPLYNLDYDELEDGTLIAEMPEEMSQRYWGVKRVVCKVSLLEDVNSENAYDIIFGAFKELKNK